MRLVVLLTLLAILVSPAPGQEPERRGPRGRGGMPPFLQNMGDLELTEDQKVYVDEVMAAQRRSWTGMRELFGEMRSARQAQDEERLAELRTQMEDFANERAESMRQAFDDIDAVLDPTQRERFSQMRTQFEERMETRRQDFTRRVREGRGFGPGRMLDRVAEPLDLDPEQREFLETLADSVNEKVEEAMPLFQEMRRARREDDEARAQELRAELQERGLDPRRNITDAMDQFESVLDDTQYERFQQMRQEMRQREQDREMPVKLNLDDAQRDQYRGLLREYRESSRAEREVVRRLETQIAQAEGAGDLQRVEELRLELESVRPDSQVGRMDFLEKVGGMLRVEQLPMLDQYYVIPGVQNSKSTGADVSDILRAALNARLTAPQRARWHKIMRKAMKTIHEGRKTDEVKRLAADEAREAIVDMLSPAQLERFEEALSRAKPRTRR